MRILVKLSARQDAAYRHTWHDKVRGRIWNALRGTPWDDAHGTRELSPFAFSNPFPPRDMTAGDRRYLIVASPYRDLLAHVASDLLDDRELNVGDMPFHVDGLDPLDPDVGPPGATGTMRTGTGLLIRIPADRCDEFGVEHPRGDDASTPVYWSEWYTTEAFFELLEENLADKCRVHADEPVERGALDGPLFDGYELVKSIAVPINVSTRETKEHVLTKWNFSYTIRNQAHRRMLNTALDCGLGHRNALGLGFVHLEDDSDQEQGVA